MAFWDLRFESEPMGEGEVKARHAGHKPQNSKAANRN